jgi:hypothetical protein
MARSRKIRRQLRKAFDTEDIGLLNSLGGSAATDVLLSGFEHFLDQVDEAYSQSDEKLKLSARNLQISSDELTEANHELEALNAAMRGMLGALGQGLMLFGRDGVCGGTYSSACLTLFGAPPLGRTVADVLGLCEDARSPFQAAFDLAFGNGITTTFDDFMATAPRRVTQPDGRIIDVSYRPIRDPRDRLTAILVIATGPEAAVSQR